MEYDPKNEVITVRNVRTGMTNNLCREHYENGEASPHVQLSYGFHRDPAGCDLCDGRAQ